MGEQVGPDFPLRHINDFPDEVDTLMRRMTNRAVSGENADWSRRISARDWLMFATFDGAGCIFR